MASLSRSKKTKRWRLLFTLQDDAGRRERKALWLGRMPEKIAEKNKQGVEGLIAARLSGSAPDPQTAAWLGGIGPDLHRKLVALGLATERQDAAPAPSVPT